MRPRRLAWFLALVAMLLSACSAADPGASTPNPAAARASPAEFAAEIDGDLLELQGMVAWTDEGRSTMSSRAP